MLFHKLPNCQTPITNCQYYQIPIVPHKTVAEVSDRKPVGGVCCRDAWMPERTHWRIERELLRSFVDFVAILAILFIFLLWFLCLSKSISFTSFWPPKPGNHSKHAILAVWKPHSERWIIGVPEARLQMKILLAASPARAARATHLFERHELMHLRAHFMLNAIQYACNNCNAAFCICQCRPACCQELSGRREFHGAHFGQMFPKHCLFNQTICSRILHLHGGPGPQFFKYNIV